MTHKKLTRDSHETHKRSQKLTHPSNYAHNGSHAKWKIGSDRQRKLFERALRPYPRGNFGLARLKWYLTGCPCPHQSQNFEFLDPLSLTPSSHLTKPVEVSFGIGELGQGLRLSAYPSNPRSRGLFRVRKKGRVATTGDPCARSLSPLFVVGRNNASGEQSSDKLQEGYKGINYKGYVVNYKNK
jgi:hypothetical protein